jgi:hypothetical protein
MQRVFQKGIMKINRVSQAKKTKPIKANFQIARQTPEDRSLL